MATTKKFTKKQLREEYDLPSDPSDEAYNGCTVLDETLEDTSRWSKHYSLVFRLDGMEPDTGWMVCYSVGATEQQDEGPWEYEDEVEATLVKLVEVVKKEWVVA